MQQLRHGRIGGCRHVPGKTWPTATLAKPVPLGAARIVAMSRGGSILRNGSQGAPVAPGRSTMTRSLFALAAAVLLAGCGSSAPPQADICSAYQQALPGLLALKELELENLRNSGSEERPVWTARTIATLEVREPTYEIQTVEGGVRILKPVRAQGETFSSYGTLRSERSGEGWRHRFQSDGSSNPVLGRPRSDYGPDALVADSAEARALLERIEQEREAARIAEETRLAEEAAERQRKEQAEAEKKLRIERAVAKHGAAFATDTLGRMVDRGGSRAFLITGNSGSR